MNVGIVTPSFEQLDWLKLCVLSVKEAARRLNRSHRHVKVIHHIQDGGSGNWEAFAKWMDATMKRDAVVNLEYRLRSEKDEGMYDALNKGFSCLETELCMWLNSDEQLLAGSLEKAVGVFEKSPDTDILLGDVILLDREKTPVGYRRIIRPAPNHIRRFHLNCYSCSMVMRKPVLPVPPFDPQWKSIGDAVLMDRLMADKRRIHLLKEPLALFSFTGVNLSRSKSPEREKWCRQSGWETGGRGFLVKFVYGVKIFSAGGVGSTGVHLEYFTGPAGEKRKWEGRLSKRWPGEKL